MTALADSLIPTKVLYIDYTLLIFFHYFFLYSAMGIDSGIRQCCHKCRPMLVLRQQKNAVVKVFTYAIFPFRFYSVVDNS